MVITYMGDGTLRLQSGETSILVDPSGNRLKADVTLRTAVSADDAAEANGVISCAGEYEVQGIEIEGTEIVEESTPKLIKTAYSIFWEDIRVAILGGISSVPSVKVFDRIEEPDVLILPVHEDHFLSPEDAAKIAKQLSPAVVIPTMYDKKSLEEFAKALGQKSEAQERFTFKKKDLQPEAVALVVLSAKS